MSDTVAAAVDMRPVQTRTQLLVGILHATAVCDRRLSVQLHPDRGGRPLSVLFRPDQEDQIRGALCQQVAIEGVVLRIGTIESLNLEQIVVITSPLRR